MWQRHAQYSQDHNSVASHVLPATLTSGYEPGSKPTAHLSSTSLIIEKTVDAPASPHVFQRQRQVSPIAFSRPVNLAGVACRNFDANEAFLMGGILVACWPVSKHFLWVCM